METQLYTHKQYFDEKRSDMTNRKVKSQKAKVKTKVSPKISSWNHLPHLSKDAKKFSLNSSLYDEIYSH